MNLKEQRNLAGSLIYEMTGKKITHLKSGRPFADSSVDISISHTGDLVGAAVVPAPYRVGIDLEQLNPKLNPELFIGTFIGNKEAIFLKKFCVNNRLSLATGIAIFWSIKESFFKCLDHDLVPGKISVLGISRSGKVRFGFSDEIKRILKSRGLTIHSAEAVFKNGYICSQTVMAG